MKDKHSSTRNALIYTVLVSLILLVPLFYYLIYMKSMHSIRNELLLKEKSLLIINIMQKHDSSKEYFDYPHFKTFESGLYDEKFQKIFSLIQYEIHYFKNGYHLEENDAYLIVKLPKERYFGAHYLIVKNKLSFAPIYEKFFLILFSVVLLIFILSLFFLKSFARPFQKINKQLDTFIKDSMHEINTPLAIINVNIDLYNRKNEPNKYMNRMKAATKVLSNIYNDMDYLIKNERVEQLSSNVDISNFLKDRVEYFNEVAQMKNIVINSDITQSINIDINDKKLQRLIDNNISNAIKYSHENSEIDISLYMKDEKCHLSFKDYGVGIKSIDDIFSRYYREDTSKGGFGIGLNIVNSIIRDENIELKVESVLNEGSRFLYIFPTYPQK